MTQINPGKDSSAIFVSQNQIMPKPLAPAEYRQQALRHIIGLNRGKGMPSMSFSELALQLRDQTLRDNVDPTFEPLSLESIKAAVTDLSQTRELTVNDRTVVFSESPASAS